MASRDCATPLGSGEEKDGGRANRAGLGEPSKHRVRPSSCKACREARPVWSQHPLLCPGRDGCLLPCGCSRHLLPLARAVRIRPSHLARSLRSSSLVCSDGQQLFKGPGEKEGARPSLARLTHPCLQQQIGREQPSLPGFNFPSPAWKRRGRVAERRPPASSAPTTLLFHQCFSHSVPPPRQALSFANARSGKKRGWCASRQGGGCIRSAASVPGAGLSAWRLVLALGKTRGFPPDSAACNTWAVQLGRALLLGGSEALCKDA